MEYPITFTLRLASSFLQTFPRVRSVPVLITGI